MGKRKGVSADNWELFPEETVLNTPVVKVKSALIKNRATGRKKDFYRFEFPDWVNVVALTAAGEIVLIEQFRYGTRKVELEIPGGGIEPGESPIEAGCRELFEETGYSGENPCLLGRVSPNSAAQDNSCYTILVENAVCSGATCLDDMEEIDTVLKPVPEVFEMVKKGEISHGLVLNALMFFYQKLNR